MAATPQQQQSLAPVMFAILGSVCGAVISTAVTPAVYPSPTAGLIAAIVGGAIAPLITVVGPHHRLRASVGLLVTIAVVAFTYGGFATWDIISDRDTPHVPLPRTDDSGDPPIGDTPDASATPDIEAPESVELACPGTGDCEALVTIRSRGTAPLRIDAIEFDGPDAAGYSHTGCEHRRIAVGDECVITIRQVSSSGGGSARLVVHQNLPGPPTYVQVTSPITDPLPSTDPDPAPTTEATVGPTPTPTEAE
jgi:hypothetical protein